MVYNVGDVLIRSTVDRCGEIISPVSDKAQEPAQQAIFPSVYLILIASTNQSTHYLHRVSHINTTVVAQLTISYVHAVL